VTNADQSPIGDDRHPHHDAAVATLRISTVAAKFAARAPTLGRDRGQGADEGHVELVLNCSSCRFSAHASLALNSALPSSARNF